MRFRSTTTSGSTARRCIRKNKSVPPASTLALPACCCRSPTASPTLVGSKYSKFFKASSPQTRAIQFSILAAPPGPSAPSHLAGEGWDGGGEARPGHSTSLHPHPRPPPSQGEGKD